VLLEFAAALDDPTGALKAWSYGTHPCGEPRAAAAAANAPAAAASSNNGTAPWPGVECDEPRGRVLGLRLPGLRLGGALSGRLGALGSLGFMCARRA
jgi:hypothetical protein